VPWASSTLLPKLIRHLKNAHPDLHVELREMISSEQAEALATRWICAALQTTISSPSPGIEGAAYFDQSIYLCAKACFSLRIRYEVSTVHVRARLGRSGLDIAFVPSSCALLGVGGTSFLSLRSAGANEFIMLLQRKADSNSSLPILADAVRINFAEVKHRMV
jgi:DNA-binding transcriptional LysR family regulator